VIQHTKCILCILGLLHDTVSSSVHIPSNDRLMANTRRFERRSAKMKLYRTLIILVVTYAAETWTWNISDENAL
jgi:hypothetical protein